MQLARKVDIDIGHGWVKSVLHVYKCVVVRVRAVVRESFTEGNRLQREGLRTRMVLARLTFVSRLAWRRLRSE
jgi:hypothetical protein